MKILHKILLGFALTVSLVVMICIGGILHLTKVSDQYRRQIEANGPVIESLENILIQGSRLVAATSEVILIKSSLEQGLIHKDGLLEQEISELREAHRVLYELQEKHYELVARYFPDRLSQTERLKEILDPLVNDSISIVSNLNNDDLEKLRKFEEEFEAADDVFFSEIKKLIAGEKEKFALLKVEHEKTTEKAREVLIGLTLLAVLGAILSAWFIIKSLKSGLSMLAEASDKIAKNDFDLEFDRSRKDEFGDLAEGLQKMSEEIASVRTTADLSMLKIERYAAELKAKNREYEEFVFVAAHDLQEPLRKIMTYGSMIRDGAASHGGKEFLDQTSKIIEISAFLREKMEVLSEYSRLGMNHDAFAKVMLNDVVDRVMKRFKKIIDETGTVLIVDGLPVIDGKADLLEELFLCLFDNSIKFRSNAPLEIHVSSSVSDNGDYCRIIIEDNGRGFEQQYAGKIFRVFYTLDSTAYRGFGMGLPIVKRIVEIHGGSISVDSRPGRGTTFNLLFPVHHAKERTARN